jgi:hypothetical protein
MKTCLVSAYYEINRDKWNAFSRQFEDYIKTFIPFLKLMENAGEEYEMIVFIHESKFEYIKTLIDEKLQITLISINEKFMKRNIPMFLTLQKDIEIMASDYYNNIIKHRKSHPEHCNPYYTTITNSKVDFVAYASTLSKSEFFAWVDFGYFKNNSLIPNNMLDINKFDSSKITFTLINKLDEKDSDIIYTLINAHEKIGGMFFFGHRNKMLEYQKLTTNVRKHLQDNNITDDDQHTVLQCFYKNPSLFDLKLLDYPYNGWHKALLFFQKSST